MVRVRVQCGVFYYFSEVNEPLLNFIWEATVVTFFGGNSSIIIINYLIIGGN